METEQLCGLGEKTISVTRREKGPEHWLFSRIVFWDHLENYKKGLCLDTTSNNCDSVGMGCDLVVGIVKNRPGNWFQCLAKFSHEPIAWENL